MVDDFRIGSNRIKVFFGREINVESSRGRSDVEALVFLSDDKQVHQIALKSPGSGRRIPAAHGQDLQG